MARRVDPVKVHLVTLAIWGFLIAVVLFVVLFPKVILFLLLTVLAAWGYAKLYGVVERKMEELEPVWEDDEPTPPPKASTADTELDVRPISTAADLDD